MEYPRHDFLDAGFAGDWRTEFDRFRYDLVPRIKSKERLAKAGFDVSGLAEDFEDAEKAVAWLGVVLDPNDRNYRQAAVALDLMAKAFRVLALEDQLRRATHS